MKNKKSPASPSSYENKRKSIRFVPEPAETIAMVDSQILGAKFCPDLVALVLEESSKGCGLVITAEDKLLLGQRCRIKIANLAPIRAEVRWRQQIDLRIFKIGLMYLDN